MSGSLKVGDCVKIPDRRIGRVREVTSSSVKVRVQRKTSKTYQFIEFVAEELERAECPKGWMSPEGYARYLDATLAKMRQRVAAKKRKPKTRRKRSGGSGRGDAGEALGSEATRAHPRHEHRQALGG